jgi:hypothetical protein
MNPLCGCCEGIEKVTPVAHVNRPGLKALAYRVGTHASFLETMLASIGLHALEAAQVESAVGGAKNSQQLRPLRALATREPRDPAIAFLDAWATVADVLTFYQERIANEGFLRTALERRSVLELAWLIGYKLRPGVAASTYLAYSLDPGTEALIAAGTRAQSVPGPGELPQPFETGEDFYARGDYNRLPVRLTRPQLIHQNVTHGKPIYFKGTATNLKPGDPLLIVSPNPGAELYRVVDVEPDQANDRTKVTVQNWFPRTPAPPALSISAVIAPELRIRQIIIRYQDATSFGVNADSRMAQRALQQLTQLQNGLDQQPTGTTPPRDQVLLDLLDQALSPLREEHRLALEANFTKLEPWIGGIIQELESVREELSHTGGEPEPAIVQISSLLKALERGPSTQPASRQQLAPSVKNILSGSSDALTKVFAQLRPTLQGNLYRTLENIKPTAPSSVQAFALRTRTSVYGHNAPLKPQTDPTSGRITAYEEWTLTSDTGKAVVDDFEIRLTFAVGHSAATITVTLKRAGTALGSVSFTPSTLQDSTQTQTISGANETVVLTVSGTAGNSDRATFTLEFRTRAFQIVIDWLLRRFTVSSAGRNLVQVEHVSNPFATSGDVDIIEVFGSVAMRGTPTEQANFVTLDSTDSKILPGSWVAIEKPIKSDPNNLFVPEDPLIASVVGARETSRADYGITGKGTQLQLSKNWIDPEQDLFDIIRGTTVFAGSEQLELAEEPIDPVAEAVSGNEIELAGVVNGLEPGRWLIITGERADIVEQPPRLLSRRDGQNAATALNAPAGETSAATKDAVPGVKAAELIMLAGVAQGYDPTLLGDKTHTTLILAEPLAYRYKRDTVKLYGNVVRATNGETKNEILGSGNASQEMQSFTLRQPPVTFLAAPTPAGAESTLQVRINQVLWKETDSLADLTPLDRKYVTRIDDENNTKIIFGNGEHGSRLPTGQENVTAIYRSGIGKVGNVKAEQITLLITKPLNVKEVINPIAATGGADREDRNTARRNAPLAVKALDRLVSTVDYEDFARTFAGIAKASAARLSDGLREVVHLTIAGADDIPISANSDLYRNLRVALSKLGDPFQPVQIVNRFLKLLVISANVQIHPDYIWEAVEPKIRTALLDCFSFNQRQLGQDVVLSEVIGTIQSVDGVVYVDVDTLDDVPEDISAEELATVSRQLGLYPRIRAYLAQIDRSAIDPELRIRPAQLALLSPVIPETLILKELKG